ncbi:OadG family protein [Shewanella salipaludis]|uniref:Probable oxaloacetate decarboxylase gamma chain n=1 Tax=Shewanella salipaludis TaxID=2723052 RepID=A0A972JN45_9GAMM|nr:OadG family transporter subunit [Shewanella salipaludis]NMH65796.1 sodium pump decarboxylase subunit gamma [Shewanella salipaludis]
MTSLTQQLVDALGIMVLGMGLVFLFLGILILGVELVARCLSRANEASTPSMSEQPMPALDSRLVAAISSAVHQYRASA